MRIFCDGLSCKVLKNGYSILEKDVITGMLTDLKKQRLKISIEIMPNTEPDFAALETILFAFTLAKQIKEADQTKEVSILCEVIETAHGSSYWIGKIEYCKNVQNTVDFYTCFQQYTTILDLYKKLTGVEYEVRYQREFKRQKEAIEITKGILARRKSYWDGLGVKSLTVSKPCRICGLIDCKGVNNKYSSNHITFYCPNHGLYTVNINEDVSDIDFEDEIRNKIKKDVYAMINQNQEYDYEIIRIEESQYRDLETKNA